MPDPTALPDLVLAELIAVDDQTALAASGRPDGAGNQGPGSDA